MPTRFQVLIPIGIAAAIVGVAGIISMPSEINPNSIILIAFCSIITTIIVSIYPAAKASSLDTVKTLKYE